MLFCFIDSTYIEPAFNLIGNFREGNRLVVLIFIKFFIPNIRNLERTCVDIDSDHEEVILEIL